VLRVWPNSAHKINKMQSICYRPDWTSTQELLHATMIYWNQRLSKDWHGKKSQHLPWSTNPQIRLPPCRPPCSLKGKRRGQGGGPPGDRTVNGGCFYRRNRNIRWPNINYSYVIHLTSDSSMWIIKWSRFDEIFTSAVSDRPSEQRFKKSNFWSTPESLFFGVTFK
jgi:hypothetical protein